MLEHMQALLEPKLTFQRCDPQNSFLDHLPVEGAIGDHTANPPHLQRGLDPRAKHGISQDPGRQHTLVLLSPDSRCQSPPHSRSPGARFPLPPLSRV